MTAGARGGPLVGSAGGTLPSFGTGSSIGKLIAGGVGLSHLIDTSKVNHHNLNTPFEYVYALTW
jgi:hypothetical protein